jgi:hypothetical protein
MPLARYAGLDFYNPSTADGFNVPVMISVDDSGGCACAPLSASGVTERDRRPYANGAVLRPQHRARMRTDEHLPDRDELHGPLLLNAARTLLDEEGTIGGRKYMTGDAKHDGQ